MPHTKGDWKKVVKHRGTGKDALINVELPNGLVLNIGRISDDDCTVETCCCKEEHANAKLIAFAPKMLEYIKKKAMEECEDAQLIITTLYNPKS